MLSFPRFAARQFFQVLRKAGLLKPVRLNLTPCVRLITDGAHLTLQAFDSQLSVSWAIPLSHPPETLVVPLAFFADCSQRTEDYVTVGERNGRLSAVWTDRGMPVERDYDPISADELPPMPVAPTAWSENPSTLLTALRDAMATTDPESQRYALGCVQLSGAEGRIAATDSRQALVQGGFQFPWPEDVLIPARKVFRSELLPHDLPVRIGRTEQQVVIVSGAWTIAFTIETDKHFPDVLKAIPSVMAVRTRLQMHPDDVRFVTDRLGELPQDDELHQAVTVDLNGSVAIRSRRSAQAAATELVLRRSQRDGGEIRLTTDRRLLQRALDLGFTEIGFTSPEGAVVCRDATRQFVWMVLAPGDAVPASDNVYQVDSLTAPAKRNRVARHLASAAAASLTGNTPPRTQVVTPATPETLHPTSTSNRKRSMPKNSHALPSEAEVITQLLDLRQQLRTMEQALVTIARNLRARRKQQQLMKSTLASLKQLQTLGV